MSYGFADIMGCLSIWFSGIPAATPTAAAPRQAGGGRLYVDRSDRAFDVCYQPTIDLVTRTIRKILAQERKAAPTKRAAPVGRPTQAELSSAFDRLFGLPDLAALAAGQAAAVRAALEQAAVEADWQRDRDYAFAAFAAERAREADDEEAILLLL